MDMTVTPTDPKAILAELRASIDNIDAALVHMLAERFRRTQAVGRLKRDHAMPPADPAREKHQIERLRRLADEAQLDPDFAEKFLNFIIREVIRHHEAIAASGAIHPVPLPVSHPDSGELGKDGADASIDPGRSDGLDKGPVLGSDDELPTQMG